MRECLICGHRVTDNITEPAGHELEYLNGRFECKKCTYTEDPVYGWPTDIKYRTISCYFGNGHRGIDIPGSFGSNIYAIMGGTVLKAEYHESWGNYVLIEHPTGLCSLYAHNSALLVKAGQKVESGQIIASMGSTGNSTGNHCHLEIWASKNGVNNLINPLTVI